MNRTVQHDHDQDIHLGCPGGFMGSAFAVENNILPSVGSIQLASEP